MAKEEVKTMIVAVKPRLAIPHNIDINQKRYSFSPTATVPVKVGESLLRTNPDLYFVPTGPVSTDGYRMRSAFEKVQLQTLIASLSKEQQLELYEAGQKILDGGTPANDSDEAAVQLDELATLNAKLRREKADLQLKLDAAIAQAEALAATITDLTNQLAAAKANSNPVTGGDAGGGKNAGGKKAK